MKDNLRGIIIDSREKKPLEFSVPTEVAGLRTGDYSIPGYESKWCVEHKTIKDLIGTCDVTNRKRFKRELQRMKDGFDFYAIVISGNEDDILPQCKKTYLTQWKMYVKKRAKGEKCRPPMRPEVRHLSVLGSLKSFRADFNCHFYFLGDRERTSAWIEEQARYFLRHEGEEDG
jgi:ERCC4-type nuclease